MAKHSIFIVDPLDQVIEVSLRKFGYEVQAFSDGIKALNVAQNNPPDLFIIENQIQGINGIELCHQIKAGSQTKEIAIIFLTSEEHLQEAALEAGADDFVVKPVYVGELSSRIEQTLASKKRKGVEKGKNDQFFGRLEEMALVDLLRLAEVSKRTGILSIDHRKQKGVIYFKDGQLIDASVGNLSAMDAVYRLFTWDKGNVVFDFKAVPTQPTKINKSMNELVADGMKKLDLWSKICEQLPSLDTVFRVDQSVIANRVGDFSEINQRLLGLFDGKRSITEVIDLAPYSDIDSLSAIVQLYFEALIYEVKEKALDQQAPAVFIEKAPHHSVPPAPITFNQFNTGFDSGFVPPPIPIETPFPQAPALTTTSINQPQPTPALPSLASGAYIPPPLTNAFELDDSPNDDLLAQLYQTQSSKDDAPPPPPPKTSLDFHDPEADQLSGLFGFDDQAHDEFFSEMEKQEEEIKGFEPTEPVSKKPILIFSSLVLLAASLLVYVFARDKVEPFTEEASLSEIRNQYFSQINNLPSPPPIQELTDVPWEIDLKKTSQIAKNNVAFNTNTASNDPGKSNAVKTFASHFSDAQKLFDQKSFDEAAKSIDKALALEGKNEQALILGSKIFMESGNDQRVIDLSSLAIELNPKNEDAYIYLGSSYQNLKKAKSAIKPYEEYLRLNPNGKHATEIRNLLEQIRREAK